MLNNVKQILNLMLPILVTMLTVAGMQSIDIIMSGHASNADVAGVSVAGNIWFPLYTGLNGIILAASTIFANLLGAGKKNEIRGVLHHSMILSMVIGVILIVAINIAIRYIHLVVTVEPHVLEIARGYIFALSWSVIPLCMVNSFRQFIEALNYARVVTITMLLALPINIFVNYIMIFGHWGFPRMGGVGAGYATSVTYLFVFCMLAYMCITQQPFKEYKILEEFKITSKRFKEQLRLGIPIGIAIFFEAAMFNVLGIMVMKFGTDTIAANQAASSISTMTYMLCLSLSLSLNIVVGYAVGAKDYIKARELSITGLKLSLLVTSCVMVLLWGFNGQIAALYNADPVVQVMIKNFLVLVIIYQVADGLAVAAQGVMRAYRDVRTCFAIVVITYWGICLPVGRIFDVYFHRGVTSYWQGMVFGIFIGAIISYLRIRYLHKKYQ